MPSSRNGDSLSGLIALIPSLAPVVASLAVFLTNALGITQFFFQPEVFPVLNFFALLLSICFIAVISYFQDERTSSRLKTRLSNVFRWFVYAKSEKPDMDDYYFEKNAEARFMLALLVAELVFLLLLVSTIVLRAIYPSIEPRWLFFIVAVLQCIFYVLSMVCSSGLIFTAIKFYLRRSKRFKEEDFKDNLDEAVVTNGLVPKNLIIHNKRFLEDENGRPVFRREVLCSLNGNKYFRLIVSYEGTYIESVQELAELPSTGPEVSPSQEA